MSRLLTVLGTAVAAWVIGALPWLTDGLLLPISSAWPTVLPDSTVRVALPAGEYRLVALGTAGVIGVTAAAVLARLLRRPAWVGAAGGVLGMVVAGLQTAVVLRPLVSSSRAALLLLAGMLLVWVTGVILGLLVGVGLGHLWTTRTTWSAVCGALVAALAHGWLVDLLVRDLVDTPLEEVVTRRALVLLAVALGLALAWAGGRGLVLVVRWMLVLAVFWVVGALVTAVQFGAAYARGNPTLELLYAVGQVAVMAMRPEAFDLVWVLGGVLVAVVLGFAARMRGYRGTPLASEAGRAGGDSGRLQD